VRTIRHALQHLAVQLTVAGVVVVAVALIVFGAEGTSIAHAFLTALFAVGALAFLLGVLGLGGVSPVGTIANMWVRVWTDDSTPPPGETVVNGTAVLLLTGALLIGAGILVDIERRAGHTVAAPSGTRTCFEIWRPDNSFIEVGGVDPRRFRVVDVVEYEGYSTEDPSGSDRGCSYRFHDDKSYAEIDIPTDPLGDPVGPPFPNDSGRFGSNPDRGDLAYNALVLPDGQLKPLGRERELRRF
jgi:hypothetical protein